MAINRAIFMFLLRSFEGTQEAHLKTFAYFALLGQVDI